MGYLTDSVGFGSRWLPQGEGGGFNDPFMLPSNEYFPTRLDNMFDFCAHLWYLNSPYRQASIRVCSHFITDIGFEGEAGDKKERKFLKELLHDSVQIKMAMLGMGMDWCFQGDTVVPTKEGVFPIRDLAGRTVQVLTEGGQYRPATFRNYGRQRLMRVTFPDGRSLLVTPEHEWIVRNGGGRKVRVRTDELKPTSHRIERTVAVRPVKNEDYDEGVRHGFVYGDGNLYNVNAPNKQQASTASFFGEKDSAMETFFASHHTPIRPREDESGARPEGDPGHCRRQHGHPGHWKELPAPTASDSYWYGFVSGFLAADGCVDCRDGCVVLTQAAKKSMQPIVDQLPRLGMAAGELREYDAESVLPDGSTHFCRMAYVNLLKQFMQPDDFLIPVHRKHFERHWNPTSKYGRFTRIKSVEHTDLVEDVFCCEEPETRSFTVGNGILTSNCAYGNGFAWMHFPFNRYLVDMRNPDHPREWALENFESYGEVRYVHDKAMYEVVDPLTVTKKEKDRKRIMLPIRDRVVQDLEKVRVIRLDPRDVTLRYSRWADQSEVILRFDADFINDIKNSRLYQINSTPLGMLKAIAENKDFLFDPEEIFHLKAPCISGISNHGWGVPEVLANYRELHQVQVLRKIDEAVGMDYMLPFRIFSPNMSAAGIGDSAYYMLLGQWEQKVKNLIADRRKTPFAIHAMPFPVQYDEHGASGKQLSPKDNLEYQINTMLDGMGYPSELFHGTLQVPQIPTTLRLFENAFQHLFRGFHNFLRWNTKKIQRYGSLEEISVVLEPPRMADNLEKTPMFLQLAAGGEMPRSLALRDFNIDDVAEMYRRRKEEDADMQRIDIELEQKLQREQQLGSLSEQILAEQGAAGGAPGGAGLTPLDTMREIESEAQAIVQMPQGAAQQRWEQLRQGDPNFYAMVKQKAEEYRRGAESQGRASLKGGGG
jgi:hypothetical protein